MGRLQRKEQTYVRSRLEQNHDSYQRDANPPKKVQEAQRVRPPEGPAKLRQPSYRRPSPPKEQFSSDYEQFVIQPRPG